MRILIDTNVIISAIIFPESKTAFVFKHILESHIPVISTYSVKESYSVFSRKFPNAIPALEAFYKEIDCEFFSTPETLKPADFPDIRDSKDLPILASAILSDVDVILTGDKDFEEIKMRKPLVLTPSQYYDLL